MNSAGDRADAEATELDRHLQEFARNLHRAGWADEACSVAASTAYLRETWSAPVGDSTRALYDAIELIRDNADAVLSIITETMPDELLK